MPSAPPARFTTTAIALHWLVALGIAVLTVIGLVMVHAGLAPMRLFQLYQLHKSIGVLVLLTVALRIAWRLGHSPPELPATMPAAEKAAASASHLLLYALLFAVPLTGWALVSSSPLNIPTVLFGVVRWPDLPVLPTLASKAHAEAMLKEVHAYASYVLIALAALHAAAALRHHFVLKDDVLLRMLPGRQAAPGEPQKKQP